MSKFHALISNDSFPKISHSFLFFKNFHDSFTEIFQKKGFFFPVSAFWASKKGRGNAETPMALLMPPPPDIFSFVEPGFAGRSDACLGPQHNSRGSFLAHESIESIVRQNMESRPPRLSAQPEEWEVPRCLGFWRFSRWWFQTLFIFTPPWGNDPIWLICFKWVETTN